MPDCTFTIPINGSKEDLLTKAKSGITAMGGTFEGDTASGSFTLTSPVSISGSYTISGTNMAIIITDKPFFISCSMIEKQLLKLMEESA